MLYDHAIPGNSLTQEPDGRTTQWFRARSDVTSYGPHNVFSGEGNSTSGATPFMAGMLAMVQSAALNARDRHVIPRPAHPERGAPGDDGHREPGDSADAGAQRCRAVARQPQERHRRRPHELVDAVRLWPSRHRRGDGGCDVGTRAAHGRDRLAALVRVRRSGPPAQAEDPRRRRAERLAIARRSLDPRVGARRGPRRLGLPHDRPRSRRSARRPWHAGPAPDPAPVCGEGPVVDAATGRARAIHGHAAAAGSSTATASRPRIAVPSPPATTPTCWQAIRARSGRR